MKSNELRQKFLDFFKSKEHNILPSASLIPENDPSVLFTTAGMHPLVPFLLGQKHPQGVRLASVQKCVRTGDIEEIGDKTHHTFFEMLGNWSLGDYFKQESITWSHEFLTEILQIPANKLAVTVFAGDSDAPRDTDAADIWENLGMPKERVVYLGKDDNWWPSGGKMPGPQGPDTEIFYFTGQGEPPPVYDPQDKRWVEIWNNVFMQFNKKEDGTYEPLSQKNVDTGMGLERTLAVLSGIDDNYRTDLFWPIISEMENISGKKYEDDEETKKQLRIIVDHMKAAVMIMGDKNGVAPSNLDQGYIVRRLIRRAIRVAKQLGVAEKFAVKLVNPIYAIYESIYPEMRFQKEFVMENLAQEEDKFLKTLEMGLKHFDELSKKQQVLTGKDLFVLFSTYGFPLELSLEIVKEKNILLEDGALNNFDLALKTHQELSKKGSEQKFKGGLADTGEQTTKLHTATHLLQAALRQVLGEQVRQKGANITAERLRFDFSHFEKMSPAQKDQVEKLVNGWILENIPVVCEEMPYAQAKEKGVLGVFEDRYGQVVKVYTIGNVSQEICGGPHVGNTGQLGHFKIIKEEAVSSGVRRIKAVLE